jgi:hypothetical protein
VNSPWINQVELDKSILELEDPSLIPRLVQDPNEKEGNEVSDEKKIIPALLIGEMIPLEGGQDYRVRIGVIMQFLEKPDRAVCRFQPKGSKPLAQDWANS